MKSGRLDHLHALGQHPRNISLGTYLFEDLLVVRTIVLCRSWQGDLRYAKFLVYSSLFHSFDPCYGRMDSFQTPDSL